MFLPFLGPALGLESLSGQEARASCSKQASPRGLGNGAWGVRTLKSPLEPALTHCSGLLWSGTRVSFKTERGGTGGGQACPGSLNVCLLPRDLLGGKACLGWIWCERSTFQY